MTDLLSPVQMDSKPISFGAEVTFSLQGQKVSIRIPCSDTENARYIQKTLYLVDAAMTQLGHDVARNKRDRLKRELDCYPNQRTDI